MNNSTENEELSMNDLANVIGGQVQQTVSPENEHPSTSVLNQPLDMNDGKNAFEKFFEKLRWNISRWF